MSQLSDPVISTGRKMSALARDTVGVSNCALRLELFREVEALSRRAVIANPLLNFKDIS